MKTIFSRKNRLTLGLIAICSLQQASAQITSPAPYCAAAFDNNYNMFNNIKVKGTTLSFGAMGAYGKTDPYLYYNTTTFPDLAQGSTASIEVNVYSVNDGEPIYFALWIDYNKNNTFDAAELVMQNSNTTMKELPTWGAAVSPIVKTITIPTTATVGKTRARLMRGQDPAGGFTYSSTVSLTPCPAKTGNSYGCTYDFDVNIVAAGAKIPVTSIAVSGMGGATTVNTGATLQMLTSVLPKTATDTSVTWSVTNVTGTATISTTGLLSGLTVGTVTVKATAKDGSGVFGTKTITVQKGTAIGELAINSDVRVYPNPTSSKVYVKLASNANTSLKSISVWNYLGQKIISNQKSEEIDLTNFSNGVYFISVLLENNQVYETKLIKE